MTRRERVQRTLAHKDVDKTPYLIELCKETMEAFTAKYGVKKEDFVDFAGCHLEKMNYNGGELISPNRFRDDFGVVWNRSAGDDIGIIEEYLLPEPDVSKFKFPVVDASQIQTVTEKFLNNGRDTFKLAKIGYLLFERAWSLRSMPHLLMDFYDNKDFVRELFARITDYNLAIINEVMKYPIDGFYLGDDYGQQSGLIMGPPLWRKFIKPELARTFAPIKEKGLPVFLHSCGDIYTILGDLIEIGLDCYQTVQPEIYDLKRLKTEFGSHLTFFGAISTQQFLPNAAPGEVGPKIRETIDILGGSGGYICAPTHHVPRDVVPEVVMAMINELRGE